MPTEKSEKLSKNLEKSKNLENYDFHIRSQEKSGNVKNTSNH